MTRANPSALVLDGDEVKLRIEAARVASGSSVHVDWVRFTVQRRNLPAPDVSALFPTDAELESFYGAGETTQAEREAIVTRMHAVSRIIKTLPNCDGDAASQAFELGQRVTACLGADFLLANDPRKGHDFYKFRFAIERHGVEVGWIGFQASSDHKNQAAMQRTVHVNIHGAACTFAEHGWRNRLADLIDETQADLTRADLALDFLSGLDGGMLGINDAYNAGSIKFGGKVPVCKHMGDWSSFSKGGRSIYFGSREAGKQTNAYEKGDQLYGVGAGSKWLRIELRYGNKLRVLPSDMLRRPADFFAGASEWHQDMLHLAASEVVQVEAVKTHSPLALETVKAEAYRCATWLFRTAGPSIAEFIKNAPEDFVMTLSETTKRPGRLGKFAPAEVATAFRDLFTTKGAGPAFA